jgi:DNA modification methylase
VLQFVVACGATKTPATNLFSVGKDSRIKEKDSGTVSRRQKPVLLYKKLLELYCKDTSLHILDVCSGAGTCAVACAADSLKCVILEKSPIKVRLIKQRVNCI